MQLDGAARDGQAQPDAAADPAAIAFHPNKWLENGSQQVVRHAGSTITHADCGCVTDPLQAKLDRGTLRGVADRVSNDILDGPP